MLDPEYAKHTGFPAILVNTPKLLEAIQNHEKDASFVAQSQDLLLYHGTTVASWKNSTSGDLYLTNSAQEALKYAQERGESDWNDDIHEIGVCEPELVVLSFRFSDLTDLMTAKAIQIEPDWGWVAGVEQELKCQGQKLIATPAWSESLTQVGSICISGFSKKHKKLATRVDMDAEVVPLTKSQKPG